MSFRPAARLVRTVPRASRPVFRQTIARRANSTTSDAHAKSSDTVWQIGSVVGWGSIAAWIYFKFNGPGAHHDVTHSSHGKTGIDQDEDAAQRGGDAAAKGSAVEKAIGDAAGSQETVDDKEEEASGDDSAEVSAKDVKDSLNQAEKANVPKAAMNEEAKGDDKAAPAEATKESKEESGNEKAGDDEPSAKDVAASLAQAEKSNVPKVAMSEEEKGNPTPASESK